MCFGFDQEIETFEMGQQTACCRSPSPVTVCPLAAGMVV